MATPKAHYFNANGDSGEKFADDVQKPQSTPTYDITGVTGLTRFGNMVFEEFLPQLRWPRAAKVYQEMADNDATVGAIMYMTKQLVRKSNWTVKAASDEDADIEAAQFVEECMHDMSTSWADTISEILSMFIYGWSFHEIIYKIRRGPLEKNGKFRSKFSDGKIGWRDMPIRSQHTLYGWEFAEDGNPTAMIQWAPPDYKMTTIPFSKGLLFRTEVSRGNPEGRSLLRNAYRSWYFKKRIEEIEGIGIERDLAGLPVLQPPDGINIWDKHNPDAMALLHKAEDMVRKVRRDKSEGLVLPHGWDFQLVSTGGSRQFDTNAIINRYDQRMAITMLADIVMLGADKVGSFALGEVKQSLMASAIEALIQAIADVFNKYAVPSLMEINAIKCPNGYPKITPEEIETPSLEDVAKIFKATGLRVDANIELYNYVMKILQVGEITEEDFAQMKKEKAEQMKNSPLAGGFNDNAREQNLDGSKQRGFGRSTEGDSDGL